jgi:hypothetical protein
MFAVVTIKRYGRLGHGQICQSCHG